MQKLFIPLILAFIFCSCKESFRIVDPKEFNEIIKDRTDIKNPDSLIKFYYDPNGYFKDLTYAITSKKLSGNNYRIILIAGGLGDDSVAAEKVVITTSYSDGRWIVTTIKVNWKCQPGRGHQSWSAKPCV